MSFMEKMMLSIQRAKLKRAKYLQSLEEYSLEVAHGLLISRPNNHSNYPEVKKWLRLPPPSAAATTAASHFRNRWQDNGPRNSRDALLSTGIFFLALRVLGEMLSTSLSGSHIPHELNCLENSSCRRCWETRQGDPKDGNGSRISINNMQHRDDDAYVIKGKDLGNRHRRFALV